MPKSNEYPVVGSFVNISVSDTILITSTFDVTVTDDRFLGLPYTLYSALYSADIDAVILIIIVVYYMQIPKQSFYCKDVS